MSIGNSIREERLKQNLKQVTLAKGICSTSYLSKIENDLIVPSSDLIDLLLKRLNYDINLISGDEEEKFINKFYQLYKKAIDSRDKNFVREILHEFSTSSERKMVFSQMKHFYTYNLYIFRLWMILDEDNEKILASYERVMKTSTDYDDKQRFLMNLNTGLFYFINGQYQASLKSLEKSLEFISFLDHDEWENADFYNVLSMTYLRNYEYYNSITYALKSLQYYKDNLLFKRAIDSYVVMGVAHKNIKEYKKAEQYYNLAKKLAIDYGLHQYEGLVYQNLGNLFAIQNIHYKAIEFFNLSLKFQEINYASDGYLITIFSIIKENSKRNNQNQVLEWSRRGLERIDKERVINNRDNTSYYFHFFIYRSLFDSQDELESTLKRAIKHFEAIKDNRHVQKYSIYLADYYFKENKFKAAGLYYQKSNHVLYNQKTISYREDL